MSYIGDGSISVKKNNSHCIRNNANNIGWERIRPNNLLFIYSHPLHYDIDKSELSTIKDDFSIECQQPAQLHYSLLVPNTHDDYYFNNDVINIYYSGQETRRSIKLIDRTPIHTKLYLSEPLFNNGCLLTEGSGIIVHTKNKIYLHNQFVSPSIYESHYHIAQDFTRNLSLPLMETNESKYGPLAGLYNRAIKKIDEAFEHARLDVPNLLCKTEYIEPNATEHSFIFSPPLNYEPQIFSQVKNSITQQNYIFNYKIEEISRTGYKLKLEYPVSEQNWNLNCIVIPKSANYSSSFIGFKENKKEMPAPKEIDTIEYNLNNISNGEYIISLYKPFRYKISKLTCKTLKNHCLIKLKSEKGEHPQSFVANQEKYCILFKNPFEVGAYESLSLSIENSGAEGLFLVLEYEKV